MKTLKLAVAVAMLSGAARADIPSRPLPQPRINGTPTGNVAAVTPWRAAPRAAARPAARLLPLLVHSAAVGLDGWTTRRFVVHGYQESDPLVRPLIGARPGWGRMVPLGIAEVGLTELLVRRYPRLRWVRIGLIVGHGGAAAWNLHLR